MNEEVRHGDQEHAALEAEVNKIPINVDVESGQMTTPVARYRHGEMLDAVEAVCPTHGQGSFEYNVAMNAWFCPEYWWGSNEDAPEDACDSLVLATDSHEHPDGGPVRHRGNMRVVEEWEFKTARSTGKEKHKITDRKEPTPPPGNLPRLKG